jgi:hypothetical protein
VASKLDNAVQNGALADALDCVIVAAVVAALLAALLVLARLVRKLLSPPLGQEKVELSLSLLRFGSFGFLSANGLACDSTSLAPLQLALLQPTQLPKGQYRSAENCLGSTYPLLAPFSTELLDELPNAPVFVRCAGHGLRGLVD